MDTLPLYQCHKQVRAGEIGGLDFQDPSQVGLLIGEHHRVNVSREWYKRHNPSLGDYYVQYADGYASVSPAKAFEDGYTLVQE